MADDIQSAGKEMVADAMKEPVKQVFDHDGKLITKPKTEWKHLAFLTVGIIVGILIGYQMNLEKTASAMATGICGTCQANLGIMVSNFNTIAKNCSEAKTFRDVAVLPALGANETIRVYN